jgi:DNA-directed RNA polymerase specialized sigma24 family protein
MTSNREPRSHKARDRWYASEQPARTSDGDVDPGIWLYRNMIIPESPAENTPEKVAAAETLLSKLSAAQREAVELCIMQGIPHSAAAEMLGVSVNAIDQRLSRARRIMQRSAREAGKLLGIQ